MEHKQIIDKLYSERIQPSIFRKMALINLNLEITESLSGDKFINELLQNADDAIALKETIEDPKASFTITSNYLIFSHNGKGFDEKDVQAIAYMRSDQREKLHNQNQTGNKGIGFKSVFSIADYVFIRSNGFSFRFDEKYSKWQEEPGEYPWQVIPIWTEEEEIPEEAKPFLQANQVNFIFRLKKSQLKNVEEELSHCKDSFNVLFKSKKSQSENVNDKLLSHCKDPLNILFLRGIRTLKFVDTVKDHSIVLKSIEKKSDVILEKDNQYGVKQLQVKVESQDKNESHDYYIYTRNLPVPIEVHDALKESELAPKFKQRKYVPISLAVKLDLDKLVNLEQNYVYCTLSTKIMLDTPFIVNSDFLLDMSRTNWQLNKESNLWNGFILKAIFAEQFTFMNYLAKKTNAWSSILHILAIPNKVIDHLIPFCEQKESFIKAFNLAKDKYDFVTNLNSECSLYPKDTWLDRYQFIEKFGGSEKRKLCAHPQQECQENLTILGAKRFGSRRIINYIKTDDFIKTISSPENNRSLIEFLYMLYQKLTESEKNYLITELKEIPFILTNSANKCEAAKNIFFPDNSLSYINDHCPFINMIHPSLLEISEELKTWLKTLGAADLTFKGIIEQANKDEYNLIDFTYRLIKLQTNFTNDNWQTLRSLKVQTQYFDDYIGEGAFPKAEKCYFSKNYKPKVLIENYIDDETITISNHYIDGSHDLNTIKKFLLKIGVREEFNWADKSIIKCIINSAQEKQDGFLELIFNKLYCSSQAVHKETFRTVANNLQEARFQLRTEDKRLKAINDCYLSDAYQPDIKLEKIFPTFAYVSSVYIKDETKAKQWRDFFKQLGVKSEFKPEIKYEPENHRNTLIEKYGKNVEDYFSYLDKFSLYGKNKPSVCDPQWHHQHRISRLWYFDDIDTVFKTNIFWQIARTHWQEAQQSVIYTTAFTEDKVPSVITFYARKACIHLYGKEPSKLYALDFKNTFGEEASHLNFASLPAQYLNQSQLEALGFRTIISEADCLSILNKIAAKPVDKNTVEKLSIVYQHLLNNNISIDGYDRFKNGELKLLNQKYQFTSAKYLHALLCERLSITNDANLLCYLDSLIKEDFVRLCNYFHITIIKDSNLKINQEGLKVHDDFLAKLKGRLIYIALKRAHKLNKDSDQFLLRNSLQEWLSQAYQGLQKVSCYTGRTLTVYYREVISTNVPVWIDDNTLYIREGYKGREIRKIYTKIHELLSLDEKVTVDDIYDILEEDEESLQESDIYSKEKLELAATCQNQLAKQEAMPKNSAKKRSYDILNKAEADDDENNIIIENNSNQPPDNESPSVKQARIEKVASQSSSSSTSYSGNLIQSISNPISVQTESSQARVNNPQSAFTQNRKVSFFSNREIEEIGAAGEQYIYDKKLASHRKRYPDADIKDNERGYTLTQGALKKEVIWYAKANKDSKTPYDFKVETYENDKKVKERWIEVKTSTSNNNDMLIYYSIPEINWIHKVKNQQDSSYSLFCVKNIYGKEGPDHIKIKNLLDNPEYQQKDIKQFNIKFK